MYALETDKMSAYFPVKADNSLYHIIAFHHIERGLKSIETAYFLTPNILIVKYEIEWKKNVNEPSFRLL